MKKRYIIFVNGLKITKSIISKLRMAKNRIGDSMIQKEKNKLLAMMLKRFRINRMMSSKNIKKEAEKEKTQI